MTSYVAAHKAYIGRFGSLAEALEFEQQALSVGAEFLPECARKVAQGGGASAEYYAWLARQADDAEFAAFLTEKGYPVA